MAGRRSGSLRSSARVRQVMREGKRVTSKFMTLYTLQAQTDQPGLAVVVSAKVGNAVTRNRIRRRVREALRSSSLPGDVVVVAREPVNSMNFQNLAEETERMLASAQRPGDTN